MQKTKYMIFALGKMLTDLTSFVQSKQLYNKIEYCGFIYRSEK